jgi:N-acetylglutamate synthase-like GNAT family acetyltransferase
VLVRAEFELTPEEQEKLELLARLHDKTSIGELIRELIQPSLNMQKLHSNLKTNTLRFYLSEEEHNIISKHMAEKGIPARKYAAMLALKVIDKDPAKRK